MGAMKELKLQGKKRGADRAKHPDTASAKCARLVHDATKPVRAWFCERFRPGEGKSQRQQLARRRNLETFVIFAPDRATATIVFQESSNGQLAKCPFVIRPLRELDLWLVDNPLSGVETIRAEVSRWV
jgi:hypothetical protein